MGRFLMYTSIGLLAVFVAFATFLAGHGGKSTAAISNVSIHNLRTTPEAYAGEVVTTEGRLSFSQEHGLYQVVDAEQLAVVISRYPHPEDLRPLDGEQVRVTGRFGFNSDLGIYIDAAEIRSLNTP